MAGLFLPPRPPSQVLPPSGVFPAQACVSCSTSTIRRPLTPYLLTPSLTPSSCLPPPESLQLKGLNALL